MNATTFGEAVSGTDTTARTQGDAPVPPEERGRLTVDDRVVEKVAGYAVRSVTDAAAAPRRVLGVKIGEARPDDAASVQAQVQGDIASVHVALAVRWPRSVQKVADEVRERIRGEVTAITGVRVDHVDVEVVSMTLPDPAERRVT
ncbi:MAG: Asp23/Gls24 family envelope stress response protein [Mycobacteriaceae bacterium]